MIRSVALGVLGVLGFRLSLVWFRVCSGYFPSAAILPLPLLLSCVIWLVFVRLHQVCTGQKIAVPQELRADGRFLRVFFWGLIAGLALYFVAVVTGSRASVSRWLLVAFWLVCSNVACLTAQYALQATRLCDVINRRWQLRLMAGGIGLIGCVLLLMCAELVSGFLVARQPPGPRKVYLGNYLDSGALFRSDAVLGIALEPLRNVSCRLEVDERQVWDVRYTSDQYGRRRTLFPDTRVPRATAVFFGCSFLFGEGSNDDETIPSRFCKAQPDFVAVNYGVPGWGTQHMLALLQSQMLKSHVVAPVRLGIYLYLPEVHEARVVGDMDIINGFGAGFPCFELDSAGQLARLGTFASARPLTVALYGLLGKSSTRAFLGLNFPRRSVQHYLLTAAIIERSKELFLTQFPDSRFLVVAYPDPDPETVTLKTVRAKGLEVLNLADLFDPSDPHFQHVGDGHPTPAANAAVATAIAQHLQNP